MMTATLAKNEQGEHVIKIAFPYDFDILYKVRSLPGRKYHPDVRLWSAPVTVQSIESLRLWGFTISDALVDYAHRVHERTKKIATEDVPGLKGELYPFQREGVAFIEMNRGRALLADEMGLGKAQPWDSKVLTPYGWELIANLRKGKELLGPDGKIHKVTGVFPQGKKNIYKITFSDGSSCESTKEHLWTVKTANGRFKGSPYRTITLESIITQGLFNGKNSKWFIPITEPVKFYSRGLIIHPYILGALLGDGGLTHGTYFTNADQDIVEKISELLPDRMFLKKKKDSQIEYSIIRKENKRKGYDNLLTREIKNWGLNVSSELKFIPDHYKFGNIEQRIELLRGLMDTDGYVSKKNHVTQFCTTSERLCDDLIFLVQSLGGIAFKSTKQTTFNSYEGKKKGKLSYQVTIRMSKGINPFYCKRKRNNFKENTKYFPLRSIKSVELIGEKEAFCISTSQPDQLYLTDNCIVTHNTIQSLAWLQLHPKLRPAIIVCPASLKLNWKREIERWLPNPKIQILSGTTPDPKLTADIIIINYDILPNNYKAEIDPRTNKKKKIEIKFSGWVDYLIQLNPKVLIIDEVHLIKSNKALRTLATKKLARHSPYIIALSGTPVLNRPIEIFNALQVIRPTLFPDYWTYVRRYCGAKHTGFGWDFNGATNIEELHNTLKTTIMIRRLKKNVLKDLPDKIHAFTPVELDNSAEYFSAEADFVSFIQREKGKEAAERASTAVSLSSIEGLKQLAVKGKLQKAIEWIGDFMEVDGKLVVFATHHFVIDELYKKFMAISVKYDGRDSQINRDKAIQKFQNDPDTRLFIGNIQAAGVGINLTASSSVAFLELPWTPGALVQAEDRCHRIGQKDTVNVYYLLAEGTIEERIAKLIDKKRQVLDAMLDGVDTPEESLLLTLIKSYEEN